MLEDRFAHARNIGILGGTFDPIHYGHLVIAEEARARFDLDVVLFIPAGAPPHKPRGQAEAEARYLMTVLATADHPDFLVSRMEIERSGPSYTAETLRILHAQYPNAILHFIIGADSARDFFTWREPETILALARVIAATRPGYDLPALTPMHAERLTLMATPGLAISSTDLRARAREGRDLRYLTPAPVAAYIEKMGLYREA